MRVITLSVLCLAAASLLMVDSASSASCYEKKETIIAGRVTNTNGDGKTTHVDGCLTAEDDESITVGSWTATKLDGGGVKSLCEITGTNGDSVEINGKKYTRLHTVCGYAHAETGSGTGRIGHGAWATCEIAVEACK